MGTEQDIPSATPHSDTTQSHEDEMKKEGQQQQQDRPLSYREKAMANGIKYTVTDVPPLPQAIMLGVQHYLTMLGATVLIPLLLCPQMGANGSQTAEVISSIFFVSGINTLVQTSIGDRCVWCYADIWSCCVRLYTHSSCFLSLSLSPFSVPPLTVSPLSKAVPLVIFPQPLALFSTRNCKPLMIPVNALKPPCVLFKVLSSSRVSSKL